jgi:hypothetical protein
MLTCDCGADPKDPTAPHSPSCIRHQLPDDDPSDHYGQ